MLYKDYEILARVHKSMSDLYSLTDDGELDESLDILIDNDVNDVVWYEVADMEHIKTPFDDPRTGFFTDIEDAKKSIDWWIKECEGLE